MRQFDTNSLRRLRKERGLTVRQVADMLGVRYQGVQALETSGHLPNLRTINRYLEIFPEIDESYFFENKLKYDYDLDWEK